MKRYPINKWPEDERPRERLLKYGPESLSDAEIIAIILRTGNPADGSSALDLSRRIISNFGSLRKIAEASVMELRRIKGLGSAKIAQLKASFELARRYTKEKIDKGRRISCSSDIYEYFYQRLKDIKKEIFISVLLDVKNRIIGERIVSEGSLDASIVHPREVFLPAIRESSSSVIFIHNHPSGDPEPSTEDLVTTKKLVEAGDILGIKVLDHIIIGETGYYSFADRGILNNPRRR